MPGKQLATDRPAPWESGLVIVDKPGGMTSHDVVARIRRLARTRRVGHAGTLDPMATGVLVLAIGEATKLVPWLTVDDKAYAAIELLFSQQDKWAFVDKPLEPLIAAMRPAGLTHDQAMACLKDQSKADAVVAVQKRANDEIKMTGTPTFVIDGKVYGGELTIDQLKAILDPLIKK